MVQRGLVLSAVLIASSGCKPDPEPGEGWEVVFEDLDSALLCVWGTAADDVWVVGADAGAGPAVMHYDGSTWSSLPTGASATLWWTAGLGNDVWMAGEDGLILRHDRTTGEFEVATTPEPVTSFGILPLAANDVWAVGGNIMANRAVVWHFDGSAWTADADVAPLIADTGVLFKIWGESSDRLWAVGQGGVSLMRTADGWVEAPLPVERNLFTVHGVGEDVVAVGGAVSGLLVEWDGAAWIDATPPDAPQLNGVWVDPSGSALAVGIEGSVFTRSVDGEWALDESSPELLYDFHSGFVDPDGGMWAVGGFVASEPYDRGMMAHRG